MVVIITLNKTKPPKEKIGGFPVKKKRRWRIKTKFVEDSKQRRIQNRPLSVTSYSEYLAYYRCVPLANRRPTDSHSDDCQTAVSHGDDKSVICTMDLSPNVSVTSSRHHHIRQAGSVPAAGHIVRRRISNVTRKLSTTIGWRSSSIPIQDIVCKGKTMCTKYIKLRLIRSGVYNRKSALRSLHNLTIAPVDDTSCEVFAVLLNIGLELERSHPLLYVGIARQTAGGALATDKAVNNVMTAIGKKMFRTPITWAKVVSLFAVAGGLAVDCVRQGHPEYLQCVIESTGEVLEDEVASWIAINGGWSDLLTYCKPPTNDVSLLGFVALLGAAITTTMFLVLLLRWFIIFIIF